MKMKLKVGSIAALGLLIASMFAASDAFALDTQAHDFVPAPSGTNLFITYYVLGNYNEVNLVGSPPIKKMTQAQVQLGLFRVIHYYTIAGMPALTSILQEFGGYTDAKVGGAQLQTPGVQLGDMLLSTFIWPISDPEHDQYLGFGVYLHIPDGDWNSKVSTNIGDNRFSVTTQGGYIQPIAPKLDFEFVLDGTFYGHNNDATMNGGILSQHPSYDGQFWANYAISPNSMLSAGFAGTFGGYSSIDGVATGQKTEYEEARVSYSHFFEAPRIQFLLEADHDIHVVGGFNQDIGITARLVKVF